MQYKPEFKVIVVALLLTVGTVQTQFIDTLFNKLEPGQNIAGTLRVELTARSEIECSVKCLSDDLCMGYQYQKKRSGPGKCTIIHSGCAEIFQSDQAAVVYKRHQFINIDFDKQSNETWSPPTNWTGPAAALYWSFDSSGVMALMEGIHTALKFIQLVAGKMNCALTLDHTKRQWIDLGIHTEACMTRPETCKAGGAISLWLNVIDCEDAGIVSSFDSSFGSIIDCSTNGISSQVFLPDNLHTRCARPTGWFHLVMNYFNPDDGIIMYINGTQVTCNMNLWSYSHPVGDGRIVVGRQYSNSDKKYASVQVDELIFFDQTLTDDEVISISNSA